MEDKNKQNLDLLFANLKIDVDVVDENIKTLKKEEISLDQMHANLLAKNLVELKQLNKNVDTNNWDVEKLASDILTCKTKADVLSVLENHELTPKTSQETNYDQNKQYIEVKGIDYDKNIVEVRNLIKAYKNGGHEEIILKNIDFNIIKSAITTIVGPSGSGKTTILNILSGLDSATSGKVEIDEKNIVGMNEEQLSAYRLEKLGFIFQSYNLIADLSVKENVQISADLNADSLDSDEILKLVGLYEAKDKYPYQLSGGMQQRVSIARALVKNPQILVCDEPTGALDEKTGKDVLCLLQDLCEKTKTTIILVTHNPGIKEMSHAVIEVKDGHIDKYYTHKKILSAKDINWA